MNKSDENHRKIERTKYNQLTCVVGCGKERREENRENNVFLYLAVMPLIQ